MSRGEPIPPVPARGEGGEALAALERARHEAVQAMMLAEEAERTARSQRRFANRLLKTYERLLVEYNGQLRLPGI